MRRLSSKRQEPDDSILATLMVTPNYLVGRHIERRKLEKENR